MLSCQNLLCKQDLCLPTTFDTQKMSNDEKLTEIEAAAFRRLVHHLQTHTDVQNIELMITADFCRNCLAKWLMAEAQQRGMMLDYDQARERIYGMPYEEWKSRYQTQATPEQLRAYEERQRSQGKSSE